MSFVQKILLKFEPKPQNLLRALREIQKENQFVGPEVCREVAKYFSLPLARVFSLASFFDDISVKKTRKKIIKVCSGGTCLMNESEKVIRQIEMMLGVKVGNDAHPKYKLELMSCRGLCDRGPVMIVDKNIFEKVKAEDVDDLIKNYL